MKINNELNVISTRLEIETEFVFKETDISNFLNKNSDRIVNKIGSNMTTWMFENNQGIEVVSDFVKLVGKREIPYRFISNSDNSVIIEKIK